MGDPLRLYGLNALVLNAAGGVGEAIARTLLKHGATVIAVDTPNSGVAQHYARVRGITGLAAAFTDTGNLPALFEQAAEQLGSLDILVNDFPLHTDTPVLEMYQELERLLTSRSELML